MKKWTNLKKVTLILSMFFSFNSFALTEEELIKKVSEQKTEYPHYELGAAFLTNKDIKMDTNKALYWFAKSSEIENYDKADYMIAEMYYKGLTSKNKQDLNIAKFFYEKSAERGNKEAKLKLATLYLINEEIKDPQKGIQIIKKEAENNNETASILSYVLSLDKTDRTTISKQIKMLSILSEKGDPFASFQLGLIYFFGNSIDQDLEKAHNLFFKSLRYGLVVSTIFIDQIDKIK